LDAMNTDLRAVVEVMAEASGGDMPSGQRNLAIHLLAALEQSDDVEAAARHVSQLLMDAALRSAEMMEAANGQH
jgi:hypothetical protein